MVSIGLQNANSDLSDDLNIFAFSTLVSSVIIFNLDQPIKSSDINILLVNYFQKAF